MTQLWQGDNVVPVTRIEAGPCTVLQFKTTERDGYAAVQVGFGRRRASLITKALRGHFKGFGDFRFVREFRLTDKAVIGDLKAGDKITVKTFTPGDKLTVVGTSKGKGFQGVVKRHGFHGQDASHGNKDQLRASGSVGAGGVQHVFKGMRMSGRMGGDRVTLHDIEIISVDEATNSIFIRGGLPGARNSLVLLSGEGELVAGDIDPVEEAAPVAVTEENETEVKAEEPDAEETPVEAVAEEVKETPAPVEEVKEEAAAEEVKAEETKESIPASEEAADEVKEESK